MAGFIFSNRRKEVFLLPPRKGITSEMQQEMLLQEQFQNMKDECCISCRFFHTEKERCNNKETVATEMHYQGLDNTNEEIISVKVPPYYRCARHERKWNG